MQRSQLYVHLTLTLLSVCKQQELQSLSYTDQSTIYARRKACYSRQMGRGVHWSTINFQRTVWFRSTETADRKQEWKSWLRNSSVVAAAFAKCHGHNRFWSPLILIDLTCLMLRTSYPNSRRWPLIESDWIPRIPLLQPTPRSCQQFCGPWPLRLRCFLPL